MKPVGLCTYTLLTLFLNNVSEVVLDQLNLSSPSLVKKLTAVCGKEGISVRVKFYHPFKGVVYSEGHYDTPSCVFVNQQNSSQDITSNETKFSFLIPADECGTVFHDPGSPLKAVYGESRDPSPDASTNEVYMENTVMFQRNHVIQEQGDLAQKLRCVWAKEIRKPLQATLPLLGRQRQKQPPEAHTAATLDPSWTWSQSHRDRPPSSNQHYYLNPYKKRFQPKGHVESVSPGRRNGKSLDINNYSETVSEDSLNRFRQLYNFTALPFKANQRNNGVAFPLRSTILINICCSSIILRFLSRFLSV